MPLQPQNISVNFKRGVDTKTDPKQVVPGKFLSVENGIFISPERIKKRNGFQGLNQTIAGSASSLSVGSALSTYKDELNQFGQGNIYSFAESLQQWTTKSVSSSLELSTQSVIRNTYQQTTQDCSWHSSGLYTFTWEDSSGGSRYSIVDTATNEFIVQNALLDANAATPKPIAIGNFVVIFFYNTSTHHLRYRYFSAQTPGTLVAAADFATNINIATPIYDAKWFNNRIFVAYNNTDGGGGISARYIDTTLSLGTALDIAGPIATVINVVGDTTNQNIWISYYDGSDTKYLIRNYDLTATAVLAPTKIETVANVRNITAYANGSSANIYYEISAASTFNYFIRGVLVTSAGSVGTPANKLRGAALAGKAFTVNNGLSEEIHLPIVYDSPLQPTYFVFNTVSLQTIAKFAPSVAGGVTTKSILPEVNIQSSAVFNMAYLQKDLLTTTPGVTSVYTLIGVQNAVLDFSSSYSFVTSEFANNLHVSGGILSMYDGVGVVEHGFHLYPEPLACSTSGAGGSIAAGTYQYVAVYEWMDNQGQIHQSAPSVPVSQVTVGATSSNTVVIPTLRITSKVAPRPVSLVVYRTVASGSIFYRVTSIASPKINDPTANTVSFVDTLADTSITGDQLLYTTGGVVENIGAPAISFVTTYKDRLILIPSENKKQFWFSKNVIPGVPAEFSDFFTWNVDPHGGDLTSAAQMADKLILFKNTNIYYMVGDGPDDTGSQNNFSQTLLVTNECGSITPNVVLTPVGLMFQSEKGIYLLDRSLSPHYVGAAVEAYNSETLISATLISNTNQVRFLMSGGSVLVYDYFMTGEDGIGQWSIHTNCNGIDALNFQDKFTYLKATGLAMQETPGVYTDNGAFIRLRVLTSWLSMAGLQGYQRMYSAYLLGEYFSPHQLLVQIAYDFNPSFIQENYINATSLLSVPVYGADSVYGSGTPYGGDYPLYQWRIDMKKQKCQSIQLSIEDVQASDFGEGMSLSAIALMVGVKAGLNKLPPTRSFG